VKYLEWRNVSTQLQYLILQILKNVFLVLFKTLLSLCVLCAFALRLCVKNLLALLICLGLIILPPKEDISEIFRMA
jgi:hypothetical protein